MHNYLSSLKLLTDKKNVFVNFDEVHRLNPKHLRKRVRRQLPTKPCRFLKNKMAAKSALLLLVIIVALFFHFVPAKTEKSFDRFLKSDHTNNWAVLVRIKRLIAW